MADGGRVYKSPSIESIIGGTGVVEISIGVCSIELRRARRSRPRPHLRRATSAFGGGAITPDRRSLAMEIVLERKKGFEGVHAHHRWQMSMRLP